MAGNEPPPGSAFAMNDMVIVDSRSGPGMNKPGGAGRVKHINIDGTVAVEYVKGSTEPAVPVQFLRRSGLLQEKARPSRSARGARSVKAPRQFDETMETLEDRGGGLAPAKPRTELPKFLEQQVKEGERLLRRLEKMDQYDLFRCSGDPLDRITEAYQQVKLERAKVAAAVTATISQTGSGDTGIVAGEQAGVTIILPRAGAGTVVEQHGMGEERESPQPVKQDCLPLGGDQTGSSNGSTTGECHPIPTGK
ncbi:unnamed protein product, partial [Choristocarpus tenellus]